MLGEAREEPIEITASELPGEGSGRLLVTLLEGEQIAVVERVESLPLNGLGSIHVIGRMKGAHLPVHLLARCPNGPK